MSLSKKSLTHRVRTCTQKTPPFDDRETSTLYHQHNMYNSDSMMEFSKDEMLQGTDKSVRRQRLFHDQRPPFNTPLLIIKQDIMLAFSSFPCGHSCRDSNFYPASICIGSAWVQPQYWRLSQNVVNTSTQICQAWKPSHKF